MVVSEITDEINSFMHFFEQSLTTLRAAYAALRDNRQNKFFYVFLIIKLNSS